MDTDTATAKDDSDVVALADAELAAAVAEAAQAEQEFRQAEEASRRAQKEAKDAARQAELAWKDAMEKALNDEVLALKMLEEDRGKRGLGIPGKSKGETNARARANGVAGVGAV
jgi:hypothetical protein